MYKILYIESEKGEKNWTDGILYSSLAPRRDILSRNDTFMTPLQLGKGIISITDIFQ